MYGGRSFYSMDQPSYARFFGKDIIRNMAGEKFALQGIYTVPDSALIDAPMLRLYENGVGLKYVPLHTELGADDGDLVDVKGTVVQKEMFMKGTDRMQKEDMLVPEEVRIIRKSSQLKTSTQKRYHQMKESLQQKLTPQESHLRLQDAPRWFVVWSESDGSFIVSTRQTDFMYQAEIDFVFHGKAFILKEIYAVEWFKGEESNRITGEEDETDSDCLHVHNTVQ